MIRFRRLLAVATIVAAVFTMTSAQAVSKCLVWVWIDGWRCAVGI